MVCETVLLLLLRRYVTVHHLIISLLLLVHIIPLLMLHLVIRLIPKVSGIDVGLVVVVRIGIIRSSICMVLVVEIGVDVVLLLLLRLLGVDDPSAKGLLAPLRAFVRRQRELLLHKSGGGGRRLLGFNVAAAAARCRVG